MLNDKKIPLNSSLFHKNEQCSLIQNRSTIPSVFTPLTNKLLASFQFTVNGINKLDPQKAHGHDMLSIRMIKLRGDSIYKPLEMIFKSCLNQGIFPAEWKKANVVPVHKKGDHKCVENYRSVSRLSVFSNIFERLIYNAMFEHFLDNSLISSNESGFKSGDSWVN